MVEKDVVVIGSGPIGLECALSLQNIGLRVMVLERGTLADTIRKFPTATEFFSYSHRLEIAGIPLVSYPNAKPTKEQYLTYLAKIVDKNSLAVKQNSCVTSISEKTGYFEVSFLEKYSPVTQMTTSKFVVIASGNLNKPKVLEFDGHDHPNVCNEFIDPFKFSGSNCLIVGGRHSALTSALRLVELGSKVTISHWRAELDKDRIKPWIFIEIEKLIGSNQLKLESGTEIVAYDGRTASLRRIQEGEIFETEPIDYVILQIGFNQDKSLFQISGIELYGDEQKPRVNEKTMETNVRNIFVAGTAVAGDTKDGSTVFIDNSHHHAEVIRKTITDRIL